MRLFNRRKKDKTIAELESFYAKKERSNSMAWLMAGASLLVTIVLLGGVFLGGRAIYRAVTDDDDTVAVVTDGNGLTYAEIEERSTTEYPGIVSDEAVSTNTPSNSDDATADEATGDTTSTPEETAAATETESADSSTTESADNETIAAAGDIEALPNTGASSTMVSLIVLGSVAVGYSVARKYQLR